MVYDECVIGIIYIWHNGLCFNVVNDSLLWFKLADTDKAHSPYVLYLQKIDEYFRG